MEDILSLTEVDHALEPLLEMARGCDASNVSTIRTLVLKVLSDPQIFAGFDRIKLEVQSGLSSGAADGETLLRTLDLFSYGCYADYIGAAPSTYLELTEGQLHKMRQLTVVSLVQKACGSNSDAAGVVSYDTLAQEVGFSSTAEDLSVRNRHVEELVISCVYAHIVSGQLCQKSRSFVASAQNGPPCQARDVPKAQVADILAVVSSLNQKLQTTSATMHNAKGKAKSSREQNVEYWQKLEERTSRMMAGTFPSAGGARAASVESTTSRRDMGLSSSASRQTKRSRGGFSGSLGETFGRY